MSHRERRSPAADKVAFSRTASKTNVNILRL